MTVSRTLLLLPILASTLALSSCGGKSGGIFGEQTVSVTASPATISYGAPTNIHWSAKSSAGFKSSNFGIDSTNFHGGSLTDTPGTTTKYSLLVHSDTGNDVPASAIVTVNKMDKDITVVGDASQPGPNQMMAYAQGLTTGTVTVVATVPDPPTTPGLLFISPTMTYSATAKTSVKAWLDGGNGVILCGYAPRVLATGQSGSSDISSIGSWFFGLSKLEGAGLTFVSAHIRSAATGIVNLSVTIRGAVDDSDDGNGILQGLGPQVDDLDHGAIINSSGSYLAAYEVPTGGKLLWSSSPVGYGNKPGGAYQQAFESGLNWVGSN